MKPSYTDIEKRIKEKPKWYDKNGVPRYDDFHPDLAPNIYAEQVVLMKVKCQYCGRSFLVELDWGKYSDEDDLKTRIIDATINYGDPPHHNCIGDSMNSIPIKIMEFWDLEHNRESPEYVKLEWKRKQVYELKIEDR